MNKTDSNTRIILREPPKSLRVTCGGRLVGTLASTRENLVAFEYADQWIAEGFSLNPLSLPLEKRVFFPKYLPFEGLFGVFNDSLPDGWGRLLLDRLLRRQGVDPGAVTPLTRLAIVGASGMGALAYEPEIDLEDASPMSDLDELADACAKILETEYSEDLDELFALGGSSGGARPKILTTYNDEDWIIKFPTSADAPNAGEMEYRYALAAKECGIDMPEVKLFASKTTSGYFGVKRFERYRDSSGHTHRIYAASVSALLETSHRLPSLDYSVLMRLTLKLTDDYRELAKLYRLMCFNVFAHNRDDHSKNFSFIYDTETGRWKLSPAYDLTYNAGMSGEHATTVNGKGHDIELADIIALGENAGLSRFDCRDIACEIKEKTITIGT
ncbi:MAG: type II toxin-antitoxin system HipA family toxin [Clostridiales Family XIII bacterium]|jgi:serine/threonine-protein kinase HipA|nr:type II toxin-antitoxin system HipA family toxin [Clostridiales Family XIII bacterium]